MAKSRECSECGTKFRVVAETAEPISYCPFCGDTALCDNEEELDEEEVNDGLTEFNPDDDS